VRVLRFFEAVNDADIRVLERGQHLGFALKPRQAVGIRGEQIWQDLQRNVAIEPAVAGAIDLAHATRTDLGDNFIGAKTRPGSEPHGTDSTRTS
jgi:hypothetical protein